MAFRGLTEAECGAANPLQQLSAQIGAELVQKEAFGLAPGRSVDAADMMVQQFLQEQQTAPQTFRMDELMHELRYMEEPRRLVPDPWSEEYLLRPPLPEEADLFHQQQLPHNKWAEEFACSTDTDLVDPSSVSASAAARHLVESVDDPKFEFSKVGEKEGDAWAEEFAQDEAWGAAADPQEADSSSADWSEDYRAKMWDKMQSVWGESYEEKTYAFSEDNPMADLGDPLAEGKRLREAGDLPGAVLCFEVAAKRHPEDAEAWRLLGTTQAENEQDPQAIEALRRSLDLSPDHLDTLMTLAVSYTNENYRKQACATLERWLFSNPLYAHIPTSATPLSSASPPSADSPWVTSSTISPDRQRRVQDMFLRAVREKGPKEVDWQVQGGLGVLFNLVGDFDKAADCFRTALQLRGEDARLWNRLGATLANGSRPEEAVQAYRRALELCPGFVRARYNVGIACINLGAHAEAAEHFLTALGQQSGAGVSDIIWSTLRMCVSFLNRPELTDALDKRDLPALNRAFGIDT